MRTHTLRSLLLLGTALAALQAQADPATNPLLKEDFFTEKTTVAEVEKAVAAGASLTETNLYQWNALGFALEGHAPVDVVKYIFEQGAPLNMPEGSRADPMALTAVSYGDIDLLEYFKAKGVDFDVLSDNHEGGLHYLSYAKHFDPKVLDFLLAVGGPGNDPLHMNSVNESIAENVLWSEADNWRDLLAAYVALGADPGAIRSDGADAFMAAFAWEDDIEKAKHFIQYAEDPLAKNNEGADALMMGASSMTAERLAYGKELGFTLDTTDAKGRTLLIAAAEYGEPEVLKLWLDEGLDVNGASNSGETALMEAAEHNAPEAVTVLLEAGAEVNAADDKGNTALLAALARHPDGHDDVEGAIETAKKTQAVIDLLLAKGADPKVVNSRGQTALMAAIQADQPLARVQQLLAAGVEVNALDADGSSALMLAVSDAGDPAIVTALLEAGADKTVTDVFGDTLAKVATDNPALAGTAVLTALQ